MGTQVPGFQLDRTKRIGIAAESLQRFRANVRELWDGRRSRTSSELRNEWNRYARGWWAYFRLTEVRKPITEVEKWVRRHIRKCFWLRWHNRRGRLRSLRQLGISGRALGVAGSQRGAWTVAKEPVLQTALSKSVLTRYGFLFPSDLAAG